jgi:tRNA threonylcarbamoyladenosine biosynthesis protein TsaE
MIEIHTNTPEETLALGRRLASMLQSGDVVLLTGRLGTGKTLFTGGIAEGLGVTTAVTSPSFIIARTYRDGFLPLVHADVYRLGSLAEFDDLELLDAARDGVLVVEWGEAVLTAVPEGHLSVHIDLVGETERVFRFRGRGSWETRPLQELAA